MERYGSKVKYWMTFNEINHCKPDSQLGMWLAGGLRCEKGEEEQVCAQAVHNMFVAGARAVRIGRILGKEIRTGCMIGYIPYYPATCDPEDVAAAEARGREDYFFLDVMTKGVYPYYKRKQYEKAGIMLEAGERDWEDLR